MDHLYWLLLAIISTDSSVCRLQGITPCSFGHYFTALKCAAFTPLRLPQLFTFTGSFSFITALHSARSYVWTEVMGLPMPGTMKPSAVIQKRAPFTILVMVLSSQNNGLLLVSLNHHAALICHT